ncbi:substrate-binding periplasmic protein [Spartinivicinus ruber]|uniref:substrate-binding periplasmic protein n=1 Tax=Spartinivicinus ruber TaxID=2683272 RepID=UPI0013D500D9|nr:transporter substrate-binding domain-containing protein [Spartinivicinus ruber]
MIIKLLLLFLLSLPVLVTASIDDKTIIFNMGDKEYPPYMFFGENGQPQGIMYDVLHVLATKQEVKIIPVKMSKQRVRVSLDSRKLDATPRAIEWEANPEHYVFTDPIVLQRDVLFSLQEQPVEFNYLEELKNQTIILRKNYIYPTLENFINNKIIQVVYTNSEENMLNMLKHKRARAAVISEHVGLWLLKQQNIRKEFYVSEGAIDEVAYRIMFTQSWVGFVQRFNKELVMMKKQGKVKAIVGKYIDIQ